jgi:hypothetical protein
MATTPEELALDLSRASVQAQEQSENQLREKATALLAAASIIGPVAALTVGQIDGNLREMQAMAAIYLDDGYRYNQAVLETAAKRVRHAITLLMVEIVTLVMALVVILMS